MCEDPGVSHSRLEDEARELRARTQVPVAQMIGAPVSPPPQERAGAGHFVRSAGVDLNKSPRNSPYGG